jgi:deoxyribonucleoside regulator
LGDDFFYELVLVHQSLKPPRSANRVSASFAMIVVATDELSIAGCRIKKNLTIRKGVIGYSNAQHCSCEQFACQRPMKSKEDQQTLAQLASLYYEQGMTFKMLAKRFGISRFKASRLLQQARDEGIVTIKITVPIENKSHLEEKLEMALGIDRAIVVQDDGFAGEVRLENVGRACADWLVHTLKPKDILGVAWGRTLQKVAEALPLQADPDLQIQVVQILGGVSQVSMAYNGDEICKRIAKTFSARCHLLYAPAVADRPESKRIIMSQVGVRRTAEYYNLLTAVLVGIGTVELTEDNIEYRLRYFSGVELRRLRSQGAVGDHCVFFDIKGKVCGDAINAKRIGIAYEQLIRVPRRIAVAIGRHKAKAILGAARAGLLNELVTDVTTTEAVLKLL